jgi:putative RNA 2'-phosphotransferase
MNPKNVSRASHALSALLRHGADAAGLAMDAAGWAPLDAVLRATRLSRELLDAAVADNNKSRFELRDGRIRASQGHSRAGMPVTLDALEASWAEDLRADTIWHGTSPEAAESIAREGLLPGQRTHVHLADATDSKVGKRAGVAVLLGVDPTALRAAGLRVYRSPNGVLLARRVPAECITDLAVATARARADEARLRRLFGLAAAP